jgi:hypothetical protein
MPEPVSLPEKPKVIEVEGVFPSGATLVLLPSIAELILAVGALVSTVQLYCTGVGSLIPELSTALTLNV